MYNLHERTNSRTLTNAELEVISGGLDRIVGSMSCNPSSGEMDLRRVNLVSDTSGGGYRRLKRIGDEVQVTQCSKTGGIIGPSYTLRVNSAEGQEFLSSIWDASCNINV